MLKKINKNEINNNKDLIIKFNEKGDMEIKQESVCIIL